MFWKNVSPPSSGQKISFNLFAISFHAGFFLGLFFNPEDGGDTFH
jgi:hypothetical protein